MAGFSIYGCLQEQGFSRETNLTSFLQQIEMVALIKFPVHQRRMNIFAAKPNGDSLTFLSELAEHVRVADWTTFNQEAAVCHLFLNSVKCEEAKKATFKILAKTPEGDIKSLVTKLQSIEAYPNKEVSVKPVRLATSKVMQLRTAGVNVPTEVWASVKIL